MKKIVAILLSVSLLFGTSGMSFAQNGHDSHGKFVSLHNADKAKRLYDMGLFRGKSKTSYQPDLENGANRAEAIVLIGKAMGWVVDANVKTISGYTDIPDWAAPYIKYAIDNNITRGIGHGRFGSFMPVNSRMVYTWYARALQYTEDVWKTPALLANLGMITAEQALKIEALDDAATRDLIVGILFDSLKWRMRGSEMSLIQRLVKNLLVNGKLAEDAGLLDPNKAIMTYTATALSQVTVQLAFSESLNAATVTNGSIEARINGTATTDFTCAVQDKIIYVLFSVPVPNGKVVSVRPLSGIKSVSGNMPDGSVKTLSMTPDTTAPVVLDIKALSSTKLQITFSEGITSSLAEIAKHVFIDNYQAVGKYALSVSDTVLTLDLTTSLAKGAHTVVVTSGLKDAAGLESIGFSKLLAVDFDNAAPVVQEVTVLDRTHLNVRFDEAVKPGYGILIIANVMYTIPATLLSDNTVAPLTLAGPLPSNADTSQIQLAYSEIEDKYGNKRTSYQSFWFSAPNDATAPSAVVTSNGALAIEVLFSEPIDGFTTEDFTLTGKDSSNASFTPALSGVAYDAASRKASVTLQEASLPQGNYEVTITLKNTILDLSVNQNPLVATAKTFQYKKDTTGPVASIATIATVASGAGFIIDISFNEPVDGFSTADFTLVNVSSAALQVDAVTFGAIGTSAQIAVAPGQLVTGANVLTLGFKNTILDLAMLANPMIPVTVPLNVTMDPN